MTVFHWIGIGAGHYAHCDIEWVRGVAYYAIAAEEYEPA